MQRIATSDIQTFETEHAAMMRKLAPECMVLLKSNGDFPLSEPETIALYGAGARKTVKGGTGSGDVNVRHFTTIEEGLENAGFTIATKSWLDQYDVIREKVRVEFFEHIRQVAKETGKSAFFLGMGAVIPEPEYELELEVLGETAVYVLSRVSGEGADRKDTEGDFMLSATEIRDIRWLHDHYPRFLLVLNVGGVVDLSEVMDVENILLLSQLGTVTGDAFADVLLGKANPSGKLTATWAAAKDYCDIGDFGEENDTRYREGIYVGYRYFDAVGKTPLFPFGYGLSYTTFDLTIKGASCRDSKVTAEVTVTNTGMMPGKETVQLYYSAPSGKMDRPVRELGAFAKTDLLLPKGTQSISLQMDLADMAAYDTKNARWIMEQGDYVLRIGTSSRDTTACAIIRLNQDQIVRSVANAGGKVDFEDWKPDHVIGEPIDDFHPIVLPVTSVVPKEPEDRLTAETDDSATDALTVEEKILTCLGKHSASDGPASIIGNAAFAVAGAAGETADLLMDHGIGKLVLADGPAGLRLTTEYRMDGENAQALNLGSMEMYMDLMDEKVRGMIYGKMQADRKLAESTGKYWQYCSAIPIGTAVAQSWNPALATTLGKIVGKEMTIFGIQLWLAPALNIHRSPLCGRNFEYYSEDPLLSGKTAAAVIRGVQSHPGCGVTIKHFCANNQETNRFRSNSMVSERTLREIYLRGFEIAVREGKPCALMTSYNLLNGEHTCCRKDLLQQILREEWQYEGIVMTDWHVTNASMFRDAYYPSASAAGCIGAGNDLIMPGNHADYVDVEEALQKEEHPYHLKLPQLERCVSRIIAMTRKLSN